MESNYIAGHLPPARGAKKSADLNLRSPDGYTYSDFNIDANCRVKRLILKESEAQTTAARRTQCASNVTRTRGDSPLCGTQFAPQIVEVFLSTPENHFIELRENLGSPFRLTHEGTGRS